jgi:hypothetical protein
VTVNLAGCKFGFAMLLLGTLAFPLCAQTLKIKLVDGKSGHPLANTCVNVWIGDGRKSALSLPTSGDGVAILKLTSRPDEIDIHAQWPQCGPLGLWNPTVIYAERARVQFGYVLCQESQGKSSWLLLHDFSTDEWVRQGIVTSNHCGKTTAPLQPGVLTIFVRSLTLWEKLMQS